MRLSFNWLSDFVDLSGLTPQDVADRLTMSAFEVEEIRQVGSEIVGPVVAGEIVEINPHPNADKIRLTRVKVSQDGEPVDIVCGADNIIVGQRVPVALPGACVINRHDGSPLPIKETKIRGAVSRGMLCSAPELGITGKESEGILMLSGIPALGTDIKALLELKPDWILHVEPRSNRPDALSVLGLAREVAALFGRPLREPDWQLPSEDKTSMEVRVESEDPDDCPFFTIRVLEGLRIEPAPLKIVRRLEAIGVRPVNNVVDITNYVLHEMGQPLHAYDLAHVRGPFLKVRRARLGERLVTIDGRERELTEEVLAIADAGGVVGVAGVMGGKTSEVTAETTFVALEAASFASAQVRRGSRLLGLSSDSSLRFERGVDLAAVRRASDRASFLILRSCGGYLGKLSFAGSDKIRPVSVSLRLKELTRLLEVRLDGQQVADLVSPLGFQATAVTPEAVEVSVPSYRQKDVTREIDLVEEVCRLWGYDRIPTSMPRSTAAPAPLEPTEQKVREALAALGLSETWISSLVGLQDLAESPDGQSGQGSSVRVLNPLSEDHQVLRQSLVPGLIRAVAYNQDRGRRDVWLFEIGRVYRRRGQSTVKEPGAVEERRVAGVICGDKARSIWQEGPAGGSKQDQAQGFFRAKGVVEALLERLNYRLDNTEFRRAEQAPAWLHPGRSACVSTASVSLGWLGELHPAVADAAGLRDVVHLFELDLEALQAHAAAPQFQEIFSTPAVTRDLTADVPEAVEQGEAARVIRAAAGLYLTSLEMVGIYRLKEGVKSLTYRLTFQHPEHTLTNEEVEEHLQSVREVLTAELSASFRL